MILICVPDVKSRYLPLKAYKSDNVFCAMYFVPT